MSLNLPLFSAMVEGSTERRTGLDLPCPIQSGLALVDCEIGFEMTPQIFRQLIALNLSNEQIAGVLEIMEADAEFRKEKGRARWRKWRDNQPTNVSKREQTFTNDSSQLARAPFLESKKEDKKEREDKNTRENALSVSFESQLIDGGVEPETLKAWKAVRAAKRAGPISEPVLKALKRESSKAGLSLQQTVTMCCERGWQGFQAIWLTGTHASLKSQSYDKPRGIAGAAIEAMEHLNERPDNSGFGDYVERLPATAGNRPALADERLSNGFGRHP